MHFFGDAILNKLFFFDFPSVFVGFDSPEAPHSLLRSSQMLLRLRRGSPEIAPSFCESLLLRLLRGSPEAAQRHSEVPSGS